MKSFINLRISGQGLNLEEITQKLKSVPDRTYKRGDIFVDQKHGGKKVIYQEDCWILGYEPDENTSFEEELEYFVTKFKNASAYLKSLAEEHNITIWISTYPDCEQANTHISFPTINILNEIGATLDCSVTFLKEFYDGTYNNLTLQETSLIKKSKPSV